MPHTPGPWAAHYNGVYGGELTGLILAICYYPDRSSDAEAASYANAKLMAAAPDLLEALKVTRQHLALFCNLSDAIAAEVFRIADAAIAKAEGL